MLFRIVSTISILLCIFLCATAQDRSPVKFGKISPEDFKQTIYSLDTAAEAIVLADIGFTEIVGNAKGDFSLEFKRTRRVHILNKNGFDAGNVEISLYTNGQKEEKLENLKAVTYNLENGKIIETKLDVKHNLYKDKINKKLVVQKFTFPAIKEGSIIEYEYRIQSDFIFNLQPWRFQGQHPSLWSEYTVSIPEFYEYITLTQGYHPYFIRTTKPKINNFLVSENLKSFNISAKVSEHRWVMKDVPAMKTENFTSTIKNHLSAIEFQLSRLNPPYTPKNVLGNWRDANNALLEDEEFGMAIHKDNSWLKDIINELASGTESQLDKAKKIYAYVRDNFTCTQYNRIYCESSLKSVLKAKKGSIAEINLLLTAMLLKAGIAADPVILSTRSHGSTYPLYPIMDKFNYVISMAVIGGTNYHLDASVPRMGFGKLGYEIYNGNARVINKSASFIQMDADSLFEKKSTSVFIMTDENGKFSGSLEQTPGYFESYKIRKEISEKGKENLVSKFKSGFTTEINITEDQFKDLEDYDKPVNFKYFFDIPGKDKEILYFNPLFCEAVKDNPFKSAERKYPVEMPYALDETYQLTFLVPSGYKVDELPRPMILKLNEENEGSFEYRLSESGGIISLRSRIIIKRTHFHPDEYNMLREFFNLIVKKHSEQLVLKKIK